jgi:hypothetical protein
MVLGISQPARRVACVRGRERQGVMLGCLVVRQTSIAKWTRTYNTTQRQPHRNGCTHRSKEPILHRQQSMYTGEYTNSMLRHNNVWRLLICQDHLGSQASSHSSPDGLPTTYPVKSNPERSRSQSHVPFLIIHAISKRGPAAAERNKEKGAFNSHRQTHYNTATVSRNLDTMATTNYRLIPYPSLSPSPD